ncbi:MAG: four helix bundle protein [Pyrinomonadaceae bacterium]
MRPSIIREKSFAFAIRIVKLSRHLNDDKREYILSKQLMRSGTAIGALICEADYAESKPDFVHKLKIALKEANETKYWIELLYGSEFIDLAGYDSLCPDVLELIKLLTSIINTTKKGMRST